MKYSRKTNFLLGGLTSLVLVFVIGVFKYILGHGKQA